MTPQQTKALVQSWKDNLGMTSEEIHALFFAKARKRFGAPGETTPDPAGDASDPKTAARRAALTSANLKVEQHRKSLLSNPKIAGPLKQLDDTLQENKSLSGAYTQPEINTLRRELGPKAVADFAKNKNSAEGYLESPGTLYSKGPLGLHLPTKGALKRNLGANTSTVIDANTKAASGFMGSKAGEKTSKFLDVLLHTRKHLPGNQATQALLGAAAPGGGAYDLGDFLTAIGAPGQGVGGAIGKALDNAQTGKPVGSGTAQAAYSNLKNSFTGKGEITPTLGKVALAKTDYTDSLTGQTHRLGAPLEMGAEMLADPSNLLAAGPIARGAKVFEKAISEAKTVAGAQEAFKALSPAEKLGFKHAQFQHNTLGRVVSSSRTLDKKLLGNPIITEETKKARIKNLLGEQERKKAAAQEPAPTETVGGVSAEDTQGLKKVASTIHGQQTHRGMNPSRVRFIDSTQEAVDKQFEPPKPAVKATVKPKPVAIPLAPTAKAPAPLTAEFQKMKDSQRSGGALLGPDGKPVVPAAQGGAIYSPDGKFVTQVPIKSLPELPKHPGEEEIDPFAGKARPLGTPEQNGKSILYGKNNETRPGMGVVYTPLHDHGSIIDTSHGGPIKIDGGIGHSDGVSVSTQGTATGFANRIQDSAARSADSTSSPIHLLAGNTGSLLSDFNTSNWYYTNLQGMMEKGLITREQFQNGISQALTGLGNNKSTAALKEAFQTGKIKEPKDLILLVSGAGLMEGRTALLSRLGGSSEGNFGAKTNPLPGFPSSQEATKAVADPTKTPGSIIGIVAPDANTHVEHLGAGAYPYKVSGGKTLRVVKDENGQYPQVDKHFTALDKEGQVVTAKSASDLATQVTRNQYELHPNTPDLHTRLHPEDTSQTAGYTGLAGLDTPKAVQDTLQNGHFAIVTAHTPRVKSGKFSGKSSHVAKYIKQTTGVDPTIIQGTEGANKVTSFLVPLTGTTDEVSEKLHHVVEAAGRARQDRIIVGSGGQVAEHKIIGGDKKGYTSTPIGHTDSVLFGATGDSHSTVRFHDGQELNFQFPFQHQGFAPDAAMQHSYAALKAGIKDQFDYLTSKGVNMEPWKQEGQPYANRTAMQADAEKNHLSFFQGGDMAAEHPLAEVDPKTGLSYNDMLRAVHDYFGHAAEGNQFGPHREENAWVAHSRMFSKEALPALTAETRMQNSWVNFGPNMRDAQGNLLDKTHPDFLKPQDRPFAPQVAYAAPREFTDPNTVLRGKPMEGQFPNNRATELADSYIKDSGLNPPERTSVRANPALARSMADYHQSQTPGFAGKPGDSGFLAAYGRKAETDPETNQSYHPVYMGPESKLVHGRHELAHHIWNYMTANEKNEARKVLSRATPEELAQARLGRGIDPKAPIGEGDYDELFANATEGMQWGKANTPGLKGAIQDKITAPLARLGYSVRARIGIPPALAKNTDLQNTILSYTKDNPLANPFHQENPIGRELRDELKARISSPVAVGGQSIQVPNEPLYGSLAGQFVTARDMAQINSTFKDNTYFLPFKKGQGDIVPGQPDAPRGQFEGHLPPWWVRTIGFGKGLMTAGSGNLGYFVHNFQGDNLAAGLNAKANGSSFSQYSKNLPTGYKEARGGGAYSDLLSQHSPILGVGSTRSLNSGNKIEDFSEKTGVLQKVKDFVQASENAPKISLFKTLVDTGMSPEEAATKVAESQIDYHALPGAIKMASQSGVVPFLNYGYASTKFMLETMAKNPVYMRRIGQARQSQFNAYSGSSPQLENANDYQQNAGVIPVSYNKKTGAMNYQDLSQGLPGSVNGLGIPWPAAPSVPRSASLTGIENAAGETVKHTMDTIQDNASQFPALGGVARAFMNRNRYGEDVNPANTPDSIAGRRDISEIVSNLVPGGVNTTGQRLMDLYQNNKRVQVGGYQSDNTKNFKAMESPASIFQRWVGVVPTFQIADNPNGILLKQAESGVKTAKAKLQYEAKGGQITKTTQDQYDESVRLWHEAAKRYSDIYNEDKDRLYPLAEASQQPVNPALEDPTQDEPLVPQAPAQPAFGGYRGQ